MPADKGILAEGPFDCACGGTLSYSREPPGVIHSFPLCADFVELEPSRFLERVRLKRAARGRTD